MTNDAASDVYHRPMHRGEFLKHSPLAEPGYPNPR
jgi:hypothetical protein